LVRISVLDADAKLVKNYQFHYIFIFELEIKKLMFNAFISN